MIVLLNTDPRLVNCEDTQTFKHTDKSTSTNTHAYTHTHIIRKKNMSSLNNYSLVRVLDFLEYAAAIILNNKSTDNGRHGFVNVHEGAETERCS